ncbi:SIS domain-containing protein [Photorhabdus laumondii subsp. laumondii]|uniref:Phosphoheptose isomerase n=2 Tax=Photorhabdus laumondii subsp. laumondii TaxID=141679 RepID=Q7MY65_PHOLL|nr:MULTISPECIES: D-sedoheptulose 7-phosphate isomerase [Photorhabdus]AWK44319.1 phosphoheptose isomerase [Photorhabdus laumondii subsp. laumondii]AXG45049.1 SIS domain-containing protein [Photorhabdus laumondii subsp. laumondii]AXG49632.1 SIS domain-containing protein [Photorhabdus laumondii subsp. laumondii]MCC8386128.1 D-sedoheptulose 7-phosphate isomerase [Photorhabdus laumondii]MCC8390604.1 D-sedoheptulose 7-phosphate isomerase [Photorhabdus laumondii]
MDNLDYINTYLLNSIKVKQKLADDIVTLKAISDVANLIVDAYTKNNKVLLAGNGGSAADSQHIAAEFVSRFFYDRPGLPAIAMTTDSSMLTAIGNDYGFDKLFARQLQAQSRLGDIFIGISTSGNSLNIIKAIEVAKEEGVTSVVLCGSGGKLKDLADIAICVPDSVTPYIQECHICIGHMICAIVEAKIFPKEKL